MTRLTFHSALACAITAGLLCIQCGSDDDTSEQSASGGSSSDAGQTGGQAGSSDGGAGASNTGGTAGAGGSAAGAAGTGGSATGGAGGQAGSAGQGTGGTAGSVGGSAGSAGGTPSGWYAGVNLAVAEFGEGTLPGEYGKQYTYPTNAEADYFKSKGMTIIRLPFRWERLQQSKGAAFDPQELARLDSFVTYATGAGLNVILDPHNYARYFGEVIGGGQVTNDDFADFWSKLATHYKSNPKVVFGLMNEPNSMPTEQWLSAANAGIAAIRGAGASQLILVPGNAWTGGHSWLSNWYGTANGTVMAGVVDSGDNFAFEIHQYLDEGYSGTQPECKSATAGSGALAAVTQWMRDHGHKAFLGEFGGANTPTCQSAVTDELAWLKANKDVWLGFTWWAAGPWWGDYMFSIEPQGLPDNPQDKPQLAWLTPFF